MRGKILVQNQGGRKFKFKVRYLVVAMGLLLSSVATRQAVQAASCPDVRIVFARGSGGERWNDQNYLAYKDAIEEKIKATSLNYEFIDLDYPAVGIDDASVLVGAYFGAGEAYEFGESVKSGVKNLDKLVNSTSCPNTKYVVGGYSQGAMVVSQALGNLDANRLVYAATFGDPKIYLPEGKGLIPAACKGENLSDYRMYVPDCQAYKGMLGAYVPYEPEVLAGKVGTWCNKRDIFCSSHLNISDHVSYVSDDLYEDASRVIFDKICKAFGLENHVSSPHDTAILIDSTGSMQSMIGKYKAEALRLAHETLDAGGRVALYEYRDLADPFQPVQHCDFESCTLEVFESELASIRADGGGDTPESLLSGSLKVMRDLHWKKGSTKSLVVLTDANFLSPDRDGVTFDEVVRLSKEIDPVNFYIITKDKYGDYYVDLAAETGGKVVTNFDELSLLTDYIMERYDSLPRVEEADSVELPMLMIDSVVATGEAAVKIDFTTNGTRALVTLNDALLGITEAIDGTGSIVVDGLDLTIKNTMTIAPLSDDIRGEAVEVALNGLIGQRFTTESVALPAVPKTPNTGKLR